MAGRITQAEVESVPTEAGLLPGSPDLRRLTSSSHGPWLEFRKTLRPDYVRAWVELGLCVALMILGFVTHLYVAHSLGNVFGFKIGILFALWIGFWLQSVLTFGHEAAHYNMAPAKNRNDLLSDWSIWLFFPQNTSSYRRSHWQHHLHLGDHQDTEISYHNCLSPWFLAKALTGIHLASLVVRYFFRKQSSPTFKTATEGSSAVDVAPFARMVVTHSFFLGVAIALHCYSTALVWLFAVVFTFPFFASARQILEHRSATAACERDFTKELHGPVNRMFGKDFFSQYFGAAGFNRHMLHHWDPTISYTCFNQMHAFFVDTDLRPRLESAQSTYFATFAALLKAAVRNDR